jgi:hypothetical protein
LTRVKAPHFGRFLYSGAIAFGGTVPAPAAVHETNEESIPMMSDIEIAQKATMKPIGEIAAKLGIPDSAVEPFGRTKAKIRLDYIDTLKDKPDGKLILVTAISPTPAGEGAAANR